MSKKILLVEDYPELLEIFKDMLLAAGFEVTTASSGNEALTQLEALNNSIDLVVTDVYMPGMKGYELRQKVQKKNNHIQFLYVTGGIDNISETRDCHVLQKPFSKNAFVQKIEMILKSTEFHIAQ